MVWYSTMGLWLVFPCWYLVIERPKDRNGGLRNTPAEATSKIERVKVGEALLCVFVRNILLTS